MRDDDIDSDPDESGDRPAAHATVNVRATSPYADLRRLGGLESRRVDRLVQPLRAFAPPQSIWVDNLDMPKPEHFDLVIAGAGADGCVVAGRLAAECLGTVLQSTQPAELDRWRIESSTVVYDADRQAVIGRIDGHCRTPCACVLEDLSQCLAGDEVARRLDGFGVTPVRCGRVSFDDHLDRQAVGSGAEGGGDPAVAEHGRMDAGRRRGAARRNDGGRDQAGSGRLAR